MTARQAKQHMKQGNKLILLRGIYGTFSVERIPVLDVRTRQGNVQTKLPGFVDVRKRYHKPYWFTLRSDMDFLYLAN